MGMDRKLRYQQARSLTTSMLEVTLKSSEDLSKQLHDVQKAGGTSTKSLLMSFMTQNMCEMTTLEVLLCCVSLSIQELTDEVKAWRSDATDEE